STSWIESLSPWPEEFGLDRMHELLRRLGDPQRSYEAVHVVGTNGKSTTTRMVEALLAGEGLHVGAYLSPHVRAWSQRIRVGGGGRAGREGGAGRAGVGGRGARGGGRAGGARRPQQPRPRGGGGDRVPRPARRAGGRGGRVAPGPARAARRVAARDLGRRA